MKKLEMTYEEVIALDAALEQAGAIKSKPDFSLKVAYNRQILKGHIKALEEARKMSDEMKEFDKARQELINEFGTTEQIGNQVITKVDPEKLDEFNAKLDPLRKKHKKAIDEYEKQMREFREVILTGPANGGKPIELHELPKNLPSGMEGNLIFALIDLVPVQEPKK